MDETKPVPPQGISNTASNGASNEMQSQPPKSDPPRSDPPKSDAPASPPAAPDVRPDPTINANFERAAVEMAGRVAPRQPTGPKPAQPPQSPQPPVQANTAVAPAPRIDPAKPLKPKAPFRFVEQYDLTELPFAGAPMAAPPRANAPDPKPSAIRPMFDDTFRITFTTAQSILVAISVIMIVLGACGMTAYSSIVFYDWSCRVGWAEKYCPPVPEPKPLLRPEIPV